VELEITSFFVIISHRVNLSKIKEIDILLLQKYLYILKYLAQEPRH